VAPGRFQFGMVRKKNQPSRSHMHLGSRRVDPHWVCILNMGYVLHIPEFLRWYYINCSSMWVLLLQFMLSMKWSYFFFKWFHANALRGFPSTFHGKKEYFIPLLTWTLWPIFGISNSTWMSVLGTSESLRCMLNQWINWLFGSALPVCRFGIACNNL
jgi:hypothetical protein